MLEFLQMVTGIFVMVYDGQHAFKFHLGRAIGVVGPGVHFKIPIIQRFQAQPTKERQASTPARGAVMGHQGA
jgi:regulator of protease activity HflC (stomatin/prohibitin superfamily)